MGSRWLFIGLGLLVACVVAGGVAVVTTQRSRLSAAAAKDDIDAFEQTRTDEHLARLTQELTSPRFIRHQLSSLRSVVLPTDRVVSLMIQWSGDIGIVDATHAQGETLYASAPFASVATTVSPALARSPRINLAKIDAAAPRRVLEQGAAAGLPADSIFSIQLKESPPGSGRDLWDAQWFNDDGTLMANRFADFDGRNLRAAP